MVVLPLGARFSITEPSLSTKATSKSTAWCAVLHVRGLHEGFGAKCRESLSRGLVNKPTHSLAHELSYDGTHLVEPILESSQFL